MEIKKTYGLALLFFFIFFAGANSVLAKENAANPDQAASLLTENQSGDGSGGTDNPVKTSPTFFEADKNKDNYVTKDEIKDYPILSDNFDEMDAGKDGKLDQHEYLNLLREKTVETYKQKS